MSLQEKKNQKSRLTRRGLALAGAGAVLATLISATPAAAATGAGCTTIQNKTGLLCVGWDAQTTKYLNTIRGNFDSPIWGVGNPRIEVRVLDAQNKEMFKRDRSWGGNRRSEYADFEVTVMMPRDASRVCAVLFEGGGYMDMACSPVYT
ncbi:hypothetical protein [Amycolatopsis tolypomycina]|uniref:Secreted protein n=1 Tax=Amycolatopsis tolypomycina TaxID=208445 RepID=A0A1H5B429_9PSEU|nr:hypothetical protein [Amycolatopsis tolypomycina]SED49195.1 hypothetical protein SAMN04489727_8087 [Amycolatopsis tolypomycina]